MNTLSWLLYFAGVCGNIQGVLIFFAFACGLAVFITAMAWGITLGDPTDELHIGTGKLLFRFALPGLAACSLLSAFVPSERTVYLIAASQTGDKALHTETGQKAIAAIDRYLDSVGVSTNTGDNNQTSK